MRWVSIAVALVACALLPSRGAAGPGTETVRLGAVVPLTGRYAVSGVEVKAGYEFAVEDLNARGGAQVGGRRLRVELAIFDDESDATKTVARLEALAQSGVVAYLGGVGSDLHAAAAAIAEKNRVPYCGVGFALWSVHQQGFRFLFSPFWKSPDIAREIYRFLNASLPSERRPRRVAIFQERTDWGRELGDLWTTRSTEYGYQIVLKAEYTPISRDFSEAILRAKAAGAEAVFTLPSPPETVAMFRQMKELDFNPKMSFVLRGANTAGWARSMGKDGDYVVLGSGWHHGLRYPGVRELDEKYQRRHNRPADVTAGPAYACVQIVADAIGRAGALDPVRIRDAMAATDLQTVVGKVRFRPDGTGIVPSPLVQWQGGKQEIVWPRDDATARFAFPAPPWRER